MISGDETVNKSIDHLCNELMEEILCRVRVKHLLRFRSVCKYWKTLIDSELFKQKHFHESKRLFPTILIRRRNSTSRITTINFEVLNVSHSMYNLGTCNDLFLSWQFGSVNGILWLVCDSTRCIVVTNPSLNQQREIDPPPKHWVSDLRLECGFDPSVGLIHRRHRVSAFGFDPHSDAYKFTLATFTTRNKVFVLVYSLRNQSWNIFALDFSFSSKTRLVTGDGYMDGKFYWFAKECRQKEGDSFGPAIVAFDFGTETFELMPLYGDLATSKDSVVVTSRGCLELITTSGEAEFRCCEIWAMDKNLEWSRKSSFSLIKFPEVIVPRGLTIDGRIVFESRAVDKKDKQIMLIDPNTGSRYNLGPRWRDFSVFTFVTVPRTVL